MINFKKFNSVISLTSYFTSDEKCKQAIIESRWSVGKEQDVVCPYCGKHHCKMSKNGRFHCTECNKNFSCLVGTIFENTNAEAFEGTLQNQVDSFSEVDKRLRLITISGGEHGVGTVQRVQRLQAHAHLCPTALRRATEQGQQKGKYKY